MAKAFAMLQKIETDVAIIENALLNYFYQQTTSRSHSCVSFSAIVTQTTSYCKAGENINIYAGIGEFTSAPKPDITINGKQVPLDAEGVAIYTFKANEAPGKYIVPVTIRFLKPDGSQEILSKKISYEVAKQH